MKPGWESNQKTLNRRPAPKEKYMFPLKITPDPQYMSTKAFPYIAKNILSHRHAKIIDDT